MTAEDTNKIIEILLILVLPPAAIWFHDRACTGHVCINILLCFVFWIPAFLHALWYCFMRK
ncbi:hypothetical protein PMAYCL1PPCAC_25290 [Pristionchus mayeri]|uniref:Uncharacterized protein n=1 Tax=Pristionchus mayeri TaxID=1317129 RepID=A0AAN5I8L4_9BILA|nr:hypothetical protein PMAYCL1PPCAC_25286 [Pristionchus mayeri]GMR55095.1 hypothetical protein PMAYCL1PPCAC_25290 [Pristionchus mayeri]